MMLNLFSVFDPTTKLLSLNWISVFIGVFFIPQIYWLMKSRLSFLLMTLLNILSKEFQVILKSNFNYNNLFYFLVLFLFILWNNFMGLFPYIFTASSHLVYCMLFSLSLWVGLMLFGWVKNTKFMLAHLVPLGTPFVLMFFMVMIEFLSNIIRPLTLAVRLTANMIAGHLLLVLLSSFIPNLLILYLLVLVIQMMLLMLEMVVSMIQSYVFIILLVLYLKETN